MPTTPPIPTTLPPIPPTTGSNPFITFGNPADAPRLEYNLPQQTSFPVAFHRPIFIPAEYYGRDPLPTPVVAALEQAKSLSETELIDRLRLELISGQGELLGGGDIIRQLPSAVRVKVKQLPTPLPVALEMPDAVAEYQAAPEGTAAREATTVTDVLGAAAKSGLDAALALPQVVGLDDVPLAKAAADQVQVAGVPLDFVARQVQKGFLPEVYQKFSGATALRFRKLPTEPQRSLTLTEHVVVRSYLGNYGAGRVVKTFSLLPGERTTITVKSFRDQTQSEVITAASSTSAFTTSDLSTSANSVISSVKTQSENVLNSWSEASASELEHMIAEESGQATASNFGGFQGSSTYGNQNSQTNVSGGVGGRVNFFGLVSYGGGGGASNSTGSSSGGSTQQGTNYSAGRSEMTKALNSALDRQVAQSAHHSQMQVNTTTGQQSQQQQGQTATNASGQQTQQQTQRQLASTLTTTDENLTVRELANLNQSRTLNFVFRQMQQEYVTLTYLNDVSFHYSEGYPGSGRDIKLPDLRAFLTEMLVEEDQVSEIMQQVLRTLCNVTDWRGQQTAFAERVPETLTTCDEPGTPLEVSYYVKRPSLYADPGQDAENRYQLFHVPGIILDVTSRILPTDSLLVDSVLGQGEALDYYNLSLQEEAVQQARRENERRAAETETLRLSTEADIEYRNERLRLAESILESIEDPAAKADAFQKMLGECCDDKLLALLRERDTL